MRRLSAFKAKLERTVEFNVAKDVVIPFGDYKGQSIDEVAKTDKGLLYLDKIVAWPALWPETRRAIRTYLAHEPIARDLDKAIANRSARR